MKMALAGVVVLIAGASAALTSGAFSGGTPAGNDGQTPPKADTSAPDDGKGTTLETVTLGGGCFWCVEAVYQELKGVKSIVSGYAGGTVPNPTYEQVCTGRTGHAEVAQITFDPSVITYPEILEVFWKTHDPTTLNRQGNDVGTQYRSVIFTNSDEQKKLAEQYRSKLDASGAFNRPIVTQIEPLETFYPAEDYHQNYFRSNPRQSYCQFVIVPKMEKFRKVFHDKLKQE